MKTKNMTTGSPFKVLLLFSIPMILSVSFQQLYNLADNYIAGHFISDLDSFNAVGIIYPVTVVFLDIAIGFGVGCGVISAKYFGAKDYENVKKTALTGLISMIVLAIVTTIIGLLIIEPLLSSMINTDIDGINCYNEGLDYMIIYIIGVIFLFIYNYAMYMFQSLGNSKTPLYFLIFSTILNIILDIFFIKAFNMKSDGLALGTVISEGIAAIFSIIVLFKNINYLNNNKYTLFDKNIFKSIISISIPSILQGCFISIGGVLIISILTNIGGTSVAGGYSAAYKICYIVINFFSVLCNALANFVSQNIGAKKYDRIMKGLYSTLLINIILCVLATVIILPLRETLVKLFISDNADGDTSLIINTGVLFINCVVPFFIFMVIKIPLDGILKGSTDMLSFTFGTSIDLVVRVVMAFILGNAFGYEGVFFAWPIGWGIGMISSIVCFFIGRWKKKCGYTLNNELVIE